MTEYEKLQSQIIDIGKRIKNLELLEKRLNDLDNKITKHSHNGIDSNIISATDIGGFRVLTVASADVAPTFGSEPGMLILQKDGTKNYVWFNMGGTWKGEELS